MKILSPEAIVTITDAIAKKYKTTWAGMVDGELKPSDLEQFIINICDKIAQAQDLSTMEQVVGLLRHRMDGDWAISESTYQDLKKQVEGR